MFVYRAGMERMRCGMADVTRILDNCKGHGTASIWDTPRQRGRRMSEGSIYRTMRKYVASIDAYTSGFPLSGLEDKFHTDEICQKIRGGDRYVFGIIDHKTQYMLTSQISESKDSFNTRACLRARP